MTFSTKRKWKKAFWIFSSRMRPIRAIEIFRHSGTLHSLLAINALSLKSILTCATSSATILSTMLCHSNLQTRPTNCTLTPHHSIGQHSRKCCFRHTRYICCKKTTASFLTIFQKSPHARNICHKMNWYVWPLLLASLRPWKELSCSPALQVCASAMWRLWLGTICSHTVMEVYTSNLGCRKPNSLSTIQ